MMRLVLIAIAVGILFLTGIGLVPVVIVAGALTLSLWWLARRRHSVSAGSEEPTAATGLSESR